MKKNVINKIIYVIVSIFVIAAIVFLVKYFSSKNIKMVRNILKPVYSDITCVDVNCSSIKATKENKKGDKTVELYNDKVKKVGSYVVKNGKEDKKQIVSIKDDYFIISENDKYYIFNKSFKELYKTNNALISLNQKYILEKGEKYTLLNYKGEKLFENISEYNLYNDQKIIEIVTENKYVIYDEVKNKILDGYKIDKEVIDSENNTLYLVTKNVKTGVYQYYDCNNYKMIGDSFENYTVTTDNELVVSKRENGTKVDYKINTKGEQTKLDKSFSKVEEINNISKDMNDDEYYLYSVSVYESNQNVVLVDNKKSKELGFYDLKNKKFNKIYSYDSKEGNIYSSITKLNSDNDNNYLEVSCSSKLCGKNLLYVVNMKNKKTEFYNENDKVVLQNYTQYENGYKMIKYSNKSEDEKYKGKYVLYNDKNEELSISENEILILGQKIVFGPVKNETVTLYSIKDKKSLNNTGANVIKIKNKEYYKYQDEKNNTVLLDSNGNEMLKVKMSQNLKNSDDSLIYIDNKKVKMYSDDFKAKNYSLEKNEELMNNNSSDILPYKGAIFLNNTKGKYIKIVNFDGMKIRKIKNSTVENIYQNKEKNVYIIAKKKDKNGTNFGLYLAK
ncbi:unknown [Clostridium sp. CAG:433]|nr:unknown [Clostridium sp. CAG:433]